MSRQTTACWIIIAMAMAIAVAVLTVCSRSPEEEQSKSERASTRTSGAIRIPAPGPDVQASSVSQSANSTASSSDYGSEIPGRRWPATPATIEKTKRFPGGGVHPPVRKLPAPHGPQDGESPTDYVARMLRLLCASEGVPDNARFLAELEMEVEAYLNKYPEMVEELISAIKISSEQRPREIGLTILGRVHSVRAVDYLLSMAASSDPDWTRKPGLEAVREDGIRTPFAPDSLRMFALNALFQAEGRSGPSLGTDYGEIFVHSNWESLEDPYVFDRVVGMLDDPHTDTEVREKLLRYMPYVLPDCTISGVGDYPRPDNLMLQERRAVDAVWQLAAGSPEMKCRELAIQALQDVRQPRITQALVGLARAESDTAVLRNVGSVLARRLDDPAARAYVLGELTHGKNDEVREWIVRSLGDFEGDPAVREGVLGLARQAGTGLQISAIQKLIRSGDEGTLLRTLDAAAAESTGGFKHMVGKYIRPLLDRRNLSEAVRSKATQLLERLDR